MQQKKKPNLIGFTYQNKTYLSYHNQLPSIVYTIHISKAEVCSDQ